MVLIRATLLSKTSSIRSDELSDLYLNAENYDIFDEKYQRDRSFSEIVFDHAYERGMLYYDGILAKKDEANNYIENQLKPEIEKLKNMPAIASFFVCFHYGQ